MQQFDYNLFRELYEEYMGMKRIDVYKLAELCGQVVQDEFRRSTYNCTIIRDIALVITKVDDILKYKENDKFPNESISICIMYLLGVIHNLTSGKWNSRIDKFIDGELYRSILYERLEVSFQDVISYLCMGIKYAIDFNFVDTSIALEFAVNRIYRIAIVYNVYVEKHILNYIKSRYKECIDSKGR